MAKTEREATAKDLRPGAVIFDDAGARYVITGYFGKGLWGYESWALNTISAGTMNERYIHWFRVVEELTEIEVQPLRNGTRVWVDDANNNLEWLKHRADLTDRLNREITTLSTFERAYDNDRTCEESGNIPSAGESTGKDNPDKG